MCRGGESGAGLDTPGHLSAGRVFRGKTSRCSSRTSESPPQGRPSPPAASPLSAPRIREGTALHLGEVVGGRSGRDDALGGYALNPVTSSSISNLVH